MRKVSKRTETGECESSISPRPSHVDEMDDNCYGEKRAESTMRVQKGGGGGVRNIDLIHRMSSKQERVGARRKSSCICALIC